MSDEVKVGWNEGGNVLLTVRTSFPATDDLEVELKPEEAREMIGHLATALIGIDTAKG